MNLNDALKLFHCDRAGLRNPLGGTTLIADEVNEALAAGVPEREIAHILVAAHQRAGFAAVEELEAATRARKSYLPARAAGTPR